jgi:sugar transferase (PEP-CTERM/EpsH1 system associated)
MNAAVSDERPLIAHVVFHLGIGGLENGLVNIVNRMPREAYRHAIVCIDGASQTYKRIDRDDVQVISLAKKSGIDPGVYLRAWSVLRRLKPRIVHTRNLAALEMQLPAWLARVPARVHSEHGREGRDLDGSYAPYNRIRRAFRPLVHRYMAMSQNLRRWLIDTIGVDASRVTQVYSGVDTQRFAPRRGARPACGPEGFLDGAQFVVGAVGRMAAIKDHATLLRGFAALVQQMPQGRDVARFVMVGDGPERAACVKIAEETGIAPLCWFAGARDDVDRILPSLDVFCLTSLNEGINNTVLEAMACGLPVVATNVGGNPELVSDGETGRLVPAADAPALAQALLNYSGSPSSIARHGAAGRQRVERDFSLEAMVQAYLRFYDGVSGRTLGNGIGHCESGSVLR